VYGVKLVHLKQDGWDSTINTSVLLCPPAEAVNFSVCLVPEEVVAEVGDKAAPQM
jgi:hypothetical protein